MNKSKEEGCPGCEGTHYHHAGCVEGAHGQVYLPCNRWIEQAYNALLLASKSDSFVRLPKEQQDCVEIAICMLQPPDPAKQLAERIRALSPIKHGSRYDP